MSRQWMVALVASTILLGWPAHVFADVLVTLTDERFEGRLANRDAVLDIGSLPPTVSILVGEGQDATLHRFDRSDVDYVIVNLDGEPHVFDGRTSVTQSASVSSPRAKGLAPTVALAFLGVGVIVVSALNPQGGPELTVDETSADFDEETFNGINYLGFGLGAALILAGILTSRDTDDRRTRLEELGTRNEGLVVTASGLGWTRRF